MRRNIKVRPGKTQSIMGFVVGLVFVGIGLFVVIPVFGPFGIFWTLIAVAITVTNGINAFGKKGVASHEIVVEDGRSEEERSSAEQRLEEARNLYDRGLITKEEYEAKRAEILKDLYSESPAVHAQRGFLWDAVQPGDRILEQGDGGRSIGKPDHQESKSP